jgi:hypothetical protein
MRRMGMLSKSCPLSLMGGLVVDINHGEEMEGKRQ